MTTYTPPAEAVEAAARAAGMYGRVAQDGLTPEQQFEQDWQDEEYREQARAEARAALTAAGPIIAAEALREAAQWLAATNYPTDWHTDARVPDALWEAFVDVVHEGDDGRELPREEVADWLAEEAGRIARGEGL